MTLSTVRHLRTRGYRTALQDAPSPQQTESPYESLICINVCQVSLVDGTMATTGHTNFVPVPPHIVVIDWLRRLHFGRRTRPNTNIEVPIFFGFPQGN